MTLPPSCVEDAALRYDALLTQALIDIGADPERPGAQQRLELAKGLIVNFHSVSRAL